MRLLSKGYCASTTENVEEPNDGVDNGTEIVAGTDPTDPLDFPESTGVIITAPIPEASELTGAPGRFTVTRPSDDIDQELIVKLLYTGTAIPDVDYVFPPTSFLTIPANVSEAAVAIQPIRDAVPEGDEIVRVEIMADLAYTVGSPSEAVVTIKDLPIDEWRAENFAADPSGPDAANDADPDRDGLLNLLEYALFLGPDVPETIDLPFITVETDLLTGDDHLTLIYTRATGAEDLVYTVEISDDLVNWISNTPGQEDVATVVSSADNGNGTTTVTVRDNRLFTDSTSGFMRLSVTVP